MFYLLVPVDKQMYRTAALILSYLSKLGNSHFATQSKQRIKNVRVTYRGGPYMVQIFSSQKEKSMNTNS